MTRHRAAVIGCGRIGSAFSAERDVLGIYSHVEAYATHPAAELVAVCDTDATRLAECAAEWQVKAAYASAADLFAAAAPAIVSICTPDETHFDLAMAALDAPNTRAVLMEKPLAIRLEDARRIVARSRERGIVLAVNYSRRYATSHQALRQKLAAGFLGRIQTVTGFYTKGVMHNGTHWFDLARFLMGEVASVAGFGDPAGVDPTLDARLEFGSGAVACLQGCDAGGYAIFEMDILGTGGRVRVVESGHTFETFTVAESPRYAGYRELRREQGNAGGLRDVTLHAVEDLTACLDEPGRRPLCSGDDALTALEIASAVRRSAEQRRPLPFPQPSLS